MSVTEYLTDHNGNQVAFFYYIDSERYSVAPKLVWQCRDYRQYKGTCASKEEAFEAFKAVLKELKKKVPVHACDTCGLTGQKFESQDTCPDCLITDE
jgi:rubrerythrin